MAKSDIWAVLSSKESSSLGRLRNKLDATLAEQAGLERKIENIDLYIEEYAERIRNNESERANFQMMHQSMNLIAQLNDAKAQLQQVHHELEQSLEALRKKITHHEMERLKYRKLSERQAEKTSLALDKRETTAGDAAAIQQFGRLALGR